MEMQITYKGLYRKRKFLERISIQFWLMTHEEYESVTVDIAVFNHPGQQALGNIISLWVLARKFLLDRILLHGIFSSKRD